MPTLKRRINVTMEKDVLKAIEHIAKEKEESLSSVSLFLIEKALAMEEDEYFSKIADERIKSKQRRISHSKIWK